MTSTNQGDMISHRAMMHPEAVSGLDALLDALADNGTWSPLRQALEDGKGCVDWTRHIDCSELSCIRFSKGNGCLNQGGNLHNTHYDAYVERVLNPLIKKGVISDGSKPGSFDDRKLRWSNSHLSTLVDLESRSLNLSVGPTWFQHCQLDIKRAPSDAIQLMIDGLNELGDPYAFFARGLGVLAIPITRDGHAFIGKRTNTDEYTNYLAFVGGWLSFPENVERINVYSELMRELEEEIYLSTPLPATNMKLVGLFGHPLTGEADLVFMVQTHLSDDHFLRGDWPEHQFWFPIRNKADAMHLLTHGYIEGSTESLKLMFSTQMGIEYLSRGHWLQ